MNKGKIKIAIKCLILTVFVIVTANFILADVGNFNSYDSGSDFSSSSSWDYSSSSSWDYSDSDSDGDLGTFGIAVFITFTLIIIIVIYSTVSSANKKSNANNNRSNVATTNNVGNVVDKIRENDPNFSEEAFLIWAKDLFVKMQAAWTERDFETIRSFETKELFEQHSTQLNEYVKNNKINVVERVSVSSAHIIGYQVDGKKESIKIRLDAKMKDYIIDSNTKALLEGDKDRYWNMSYNMTFTRTLGRKTTNDGSIKTTACPSCGAPTKVTSSGKCEYCGNVIVTDDHDFVLSSLESIK